jgi:cyanophycinase
LLHQGRNCQGEKKSELRKAAVNAADGALRVFALRHSRRGQHARLDCVIAMPRLPPRRAGSWTLLAVSVAGWTIIGAATMSHGAGRRGHLVLLGGGPTPASVFSRTLDLSGGRAAIVAVLPQTYPNDSIGDAAVELWTKTGAREVFKLKLDDMDRARAALDRATLIWMPGGFQGLLMKTLTGTPVPDAIRRRFAEGATIGGASAGAAAMSATMIADEITPEGDTAGGPRTTAGLGLWPAAIVSPHFTERRRSGPLLAILRNQPGLIGVGIDEGTAIFVSEGRMEVAGRGTITIFGTANDPVRSLKSGARLALSDDGVPRR